LASFKSQAFVFENLERRKPGGFGGAPPVAAETHGGDWAENVVGELGVGHLGGFKCVALVCG
jgi:hypothetical protein